MAVSQKENNKYILLIQMFEQPQTFVISALVFIIGLIIKTSAQSYVMLMVGRALVGLGVGVGLAVSLLK